MDEPSQEKTYSLLFDGRLVPGRNAEKVEAEFARRFGEANAKRLFSGETVTLNRDLGRDEAQKKQRLFEQLGIVVQVIPSTPVASNLAIVDAPTPAAKSKEPQSQAVQQPAPQPRAEFGVLPDRSPRSPAQSDSAGVYTKEELAQAFKDTAEFPAASRHYLVRLLPVTALMLLLPVIYLAITLLSGAATYWVAIEGFDWLTRDPGYLRLVAVAAALLGLGLLTLFLLRPLVARVDPGPQPVRLEPQREPVLFDLVERITNAVGAPMPDEILVDSDVNASARLTHGAFSKGLTLTIGMPLLYGLDVQSLTGVLAHEFGHFTQRVGMRSSALVHRINYWFYRQIHERDNWDNFVEKWLATENVVLSLAAMTAQFGSFLVRMLLHLLSMLAAFFSFSLSRQMEYDADRYEIGLVGSAAYEAIATSIRTLGAGHQLAVKDVSLAFDSGKKVDNLPKLTALKAANFSEDDKQAIMAQLEEVNTSVFDTHPTDKARIRRALDAKLPASFVHPGPARKLLREPERLSKLVTLQWYRSFGIAVTVDDLIPLDTFASETNLLKNAETSIRTFFAGLDGISPYIPLQPPATQAQFDDAGLIATLQEARQALNDRKAHYVRLRVKMSEDIEYQGYYRQALFWRRAGFDIDLDAYRLPLTTADVSEITAKIADYKASEIESRTALRHCVELLGQRLSCGLELGIRRGEADRGEVDKLRRAYSALASTDDDINRLMTCGENVDLLLQLVEALPDEPKFQRQLQSETKTNLQLQRKIRSSLASIADPFVDGARLVDGLPAESDGIDAGGPLQALDHAERTLRSVGRVSFKILGRLCEIVLSIERRL